MRRKKKRMKTKKKKNSMIRILLVMLMHLKLSIRLPRIRYPLDQRNWAIADTVHPELAIRLASVTVMVLRRRAVTLQLNMVTVPTRVTVLCTPFRAVMVMAIAVHRLVRTNYFCNLNLSLTVVNCSTSWI